MGFPPNKQCPICGRIETREEREELLKAQELEALRKERLELIKRLTIAEAKTKGITITYPDEVDK